MHDPYRRIRRKRNVPPLAWLLIFIGLGFLLYGSYHDPQADDVTTEWVR